MSLDKIALRFHHKPNLLIAYLKPIAALSAPARLHCLSFIICNEHSEHWTVHLHHHRYLYHC